HSIDIRDLHSFPTRRSSDLNNFAAIWAMFGIANQMLAALALAVVSAFLVNEGRSKYLWVTMLPMLVVISTTSTAGVEMLQGYWKDRKSTRLNSSHLGISYAV